MSPENTTSDYLSLTLREFLDRVASGEPAPGGGSVAAVAVALAAGLSGMAARLSADQMSGAAELASRADFLRSRVAPLARADAEAYGRVLAASRLPREPDPESRRQRIREALSGAADVPLAVAEVGEEAASLAARLAKEGNPNLEGDAKVAVFLAGAGSRAAATLAQINLSAADADDDRMGRAGELADRAAATVRRATQDGGRG